jgi:hypothetical protein
LREAVFPTALIRVSSTLASSRRLLPQIYLGSQQYGNALGRTIANTKRRIYPPACGSGTARSSHRQFAPHAHSRDTKLALVCPGEMAERGEVGIEEVD